MKHIRIIYFIAGITALCGILHVTQHGYGIRVTNYAIETLQPKNADLERMHTLIQSHYNSMIEAFGLVFLQIGIIYSVYKIKREIQNPQPGS